MADHGRRPQRYSAIGYGGQLIEVVPDLRLVAVFSTDTTGARSFRRLPSHRIYLAVAGS